MPELERPHPTVLLLHALPDGSDHVDWMLGQDPDGEQLLITFRLPARVDELAPGAAALDAERLADHRPRYLTYEGPVAPAAGGRRGRGTVRRLARGRILAWTRTPRAWEVRVVWSSDAGERRQHLRLEARDDRSWSVLAMAAGPGEPVE